MFQFGVICELFYINIIVYLIVVRKTFKMTFVKKTFAIAITFGVISCGQLSGEIDIREGRAFAVNNSSSKKYQFTVKCEMIKNDSICDYSSSIITLNPGDEVYLGLVDSLTEQIYSDKRDSVLKFNEWKQLKKPAAQRIGIKPDPSDLIENAEYQENLSIQYHPDTFINGIRHKYWYEDTVYPDKSKPIKRDRFHRKFSVTGQIERP